MKKFLIKNLTTITEKDISIMVTLESKRDEILRRTGDYWRLKSRFVWVEAGDGNTIFFHKHASHRKEVNTIWVIVDQEGVLV